MSAAAQSGVTLLPARDTLTEALTRLRFLADLTAAWDVEHLALSADNLAGIGLVIDEVIERIARVEGMLAA